MTMTTPLFQGTRQCPKWEPLARRQRLAAKADLAALLQEGNSSVSAETGRTAGNGIFWAHAGRAEESTS